MSGTESEIFNNIPDFQDATDDGGAGHPAEHSGSTGGDQGGSATTSAQPTTTSAQPTGGEQEPQQPKQFVRRHDGLIERENEENPRVRDLVDPISGKVVARGGVERHIYDQSMRTQRENNALKNQVGQLTRAVQQSHEVVQEAARLGVAPQDQMIAMRVMADFMKDPVRTLQNLVEEVKSKGYQIPFLTEGVNPGMDLSAISRMIDAKLSPMMGDRQQHVAQQQARQQAERDLESFLTENQEANQNLDVLSEMLQAQPGLPLPVAYTKMIRWAHEHNLDWTQPLKAQIEQARQQQFQPQPQRTEQRPLPGRRSASTSGATRVNGTGGGQQFNENASWADIIRSAMQDHNVQLN
ncbi:MAG TPA: hypothetical protein VGN34_21535 [Ktedonobacteraceae bacterium]|jgi:hypothetical protein